MQVDALYRLAAAAELCGVSRTTLLSAIAREELPVARTGCGLPLVRLADVTAWAKTPRKLGAPVKAKR